MKTYSCSSHKKLPAVILVGNKCDLPDRAVSHEEGAALAASHGIPFFEVSAKSKHNVTEAFEKITHDVKERLDASGAGAGRASGNRGAGRVDIKSGGGAAAGGKKGCC